MHLLIPDVGARFQEGTPNRSADDRHHHVDPPELLFGCLHDRRDLRIVKYIADDRHPTAAKSTDQPRHTLRSLSFDIDDSDVAPSACQKTGRTFAHPLTATDYHGFLVGQAEQRRFSGHQSPFLTDCVKLFGCALSEFSPIEV